MHLISFAETRFLQFRSITRPLDGSTAPIGVKVTALSRSRRLAIEAGRDDISDRTRSPIARRRRHRCDRVEVIGNPVDRRGRTAPLRGAAAAGDHRPAYVAAAAGQSEAPAADRRGLRRLVQLASRPAAIVLRGIEPCACNSCSVALAFSPPLSLSVARPSRLRDTQPSRPERADSRRSSLEPSRVRLSTASWNLRG